MTKDWVKKMSNPEHDSFCKQCLDTGFIEVRRIGSPRFEASYAFKCNSCKMAETKNLSRTIPFWKNELLDKFKKVLDGRGLLIEPRPGKSTSQELPE